MTFSMEPIFIVCHPRSGSTLMRYVLDTHDDVCSPPELHLFLIMEQLARANRLLYEQNPAYSERAVLEEKVHACVGQNINEMMSRVCLESNKKVWCDKSVGTVDHLPMVSKAFPKA